MKKVAWTIITLFVVTVAGIFGAKKAAFNITIKPEQKNGTSIFSFFSWIEGSFNKETNYSTKPALPTPPTPSTPHQVPSTPPSRSQKPQQPRELPPSSQPSLPSTDILGCSQGFETNTFIWKYCGQDTWVQADDMAQKNGWSLPSRHELEILNTKNTFALLHLPQDFYWTNERIEGSFVIVVNPATNKTHREDPTRFLHIILIKKR